MSLSGLKKIQFIYPGIFLFWLAYFAIKSSFPDTDPFDNYKYYVLCFSISTLYYTLNLRDILLYNWIKNNIINLNISDSMHRIFSTNEVFSKENYIRKTISLVFNRRKYYSNSRCMTCFYKAIGDDNTLQTRSEIVMFNGSVLCCLIDTLIISCGSAVFAPVLSKVTSKPINYTNFYTLIIVIAISSILLIPLSIFNHIRLSNDQLIFLYHNKEKFNNLLELENCSACGRQDDQ